MYNTLSSFRKRGLGSQYRPEASDSSVIIHPEQDGN